MLVDARRTAPVPALFSALRCLQVSKQCYCIKDFYGLYCLNILFWNCSKITVPAVLLSYFSGISLNIKMYYILMYKQMYFVFFCRKKIVLFILCCCWLIKIPLTCVWTNGHFLRWVTHSGDWLTEVTDSLRWLTHSGNYWLTPMVPCCYIKCASHRRRSFFMSVFRRNSCNYCCFLMLVLFFRWRCWRLWNLWTDRWRCSRFLLSSEAPSASVKAAGSTSDRSVDFSLFLSL